MRNDDYKTEEYKGFTIRIKNDEDPINPIQDWDMLGSFACWHNRYDLSSKDVQTGRSRSSERKNPDFRFEEVYDFINEMLKTEKVIALPLRLYDHSGITISVGGGAHPQDPGGWDSGQVGWVFVTLEKIKKEYNLKRISPKKRAEVCKILRAEVESFDQYLTGEVYGFVIEDKDGDQIDSCWGYYGTDGIEDLIKECKSTIDHHILEEVKKRNNKLKTLITNSVPIEKREAILK